MRINRLASIEEEIHSQGAITLKGLAELFDVSINTIRRDVDVLVETGNIAKVYGGVVSQLNSKIVHINGRSNTNIKAKQKIGQLVAQYINNNAKIFIDSGTTTAQIIPFLGDKHNISIITNNFNAIQEASKLPNIKILCIGGLYNATKGIFHSSRMISELADLNFDHVLIGATGVSLNKGLTINSFLEVDVKRWLVENFSQQTILMADISKYDSTALYSFSDFNGIHTIASDENLPDEYVQAIRSNGMVLL